MDTTARYDREAPVWERTLRRLGYSAAYEDFLDGHTVFSGPVLDVGTGTGAFARAWVHAGGSRDLTLLDPSQGMLSIAERHLDALGVTAKTVIGGIERCGGFDPFSAILAAHVVEHCAPPQEAFTRFARWLRPGGRLYLVISKPHWCNWFIWLRFRHRWFTAAEVREMAATAGFHHVLTHEFDSGPPSRTSLGYLFTKSG